MSDESNAFTKLRLNVDHNHNQSFWSLLLAMSPCFHQIHLIQAWITTIFRFWIVSTLHFFFAKAGCWIRSKRSEWRQQGRGQGMAGVLLLLIVLGISNPCLTCLPGPAHSWHVTVKLGIEIWISSCSCSKCSKPLRIIASHVLFESSNTPNALTLCFKSARD